jgi:hypothetical protein
MGFNSGFKGLKFLMAMVGFAPSSPNNVTSRATPMPAMKTSELSDDFLFYYLEAETSE